MRGSDSGGRNVLLLFRKWTKQLEVKLLLQPAISDSCVSIILTAVWASQGERLLPLTLHPPAWGLLEVDAHLALSRACLSSCKTGRGPGRVISSPGMAGKVCSGAPGPSWGCKGPCRNPWPLGDRKTTGKQTERPRPELNSVDEEAGSSNLYLHISWKKQKRRGIL